MMDNQAPQTPELTNHPVRPKVKIYWPADITFAYLVYRTWWFRFILAALSGLLLILSFPPFGYGLLGWLALVPLIIAVMSSPTWGMAGMCGLSTGIVFYSVSLSFLLEGSGPMGLILANILSIFLVVFVVLCWLIAKNIGLGRAFVFIPVVWTAVEFFRSETRWYYFKFSWLSLGYSQSPHNILIQICDIVGVYGLSFIMMVVNVLFAWILLQRMRKRYWAWGHIALVVIIFCVVLIYGQTRTGYQMSYQSDSSEADIPVAVVQEPIGNVDRYIKATLKSVNDRQETLVVWPEACLQNALTRPEIRNLIEALVKDKKLYLVFGNLEPTEEVVRVHNYSVIFSPEGEEIGKYAKRVPVPFFETVVKPGKRWGIFDTRLGKMGLLICYESGFSYITRMLVKGKRRAEFLVVPTLDRGGWGGLLHKHHASIVPFRAVETRRPIVRSCAQGISMIVHPSGKIEGQLNYLVKGVLRGTIRKGTGTTFYVKYGYYFPIICEGIAGIWLLILLTIWIKRARRYQTEEV